MSVQRIRHVYEQFVKPQDSREVQGAKAFEFVAKFREELGIEENTSTGSRSLNPAKRQMRPSDFSLREMAVSFCGESYAEALGRDGANAHRVFEAGGGQAVVVPGHIPGVSAFLGSVTGLLDAAILESYQQPAFVIDELVEVIPSRAMNMKLLGISGIGDQAQIRNPGDPFAWAVMQDRYTETPTTEDWSLACGITAEAVFFDQTQQVLAQANNIGHDLGVRKELQGMQVIAGAVNPYNYKGTSYNTYLTSGNWINDQANELDDWTDVNNVDSLFWDMTDQETGLPVSADWDTVLVAPAKSATAQYIWNATEVESRTQSAAEIRRGGNRISQKKIVTSRYMKQVLTNSATHAKTVGLALSAANADKYWWAMSTTPGRSAFYRVENFPVQIRRASATDYEMLNRNMILAVFGNSRYAYGVRDPRFVVRNKNA